MSFSTAPASGASIAQGSPLSRPASMSFSSTGTQSAGMVLPPASSGSQSTLPFARIPQTQRVGSLTMSTLSSAPPASSSKGGAPSGTIRKSSGAAGYPTSMSPTTTMRELRALGSGSTPGQLAKQASNARVLPQQRSAAKAAVVRPSAPPITHPVLKRPAGAATKVPTTGSLVSERVVVSGKAVTASMPAATNGVHGSKGVEQVALGEPLLLTQPEPVVKQKLLVEEPVAIDLTPRQVTLSNPLPAAQLPALLSEPVLMQKLSIPELPVVELSVVTEKLLVPELPVILAPPVAAKVPVEVGSPVKELVQDKGSRSELWTKMTSLLQTFDSKLDGYGKCCTDQELVTDMKTMIAGLQQKSSRLANLPIGKLGLSYAAEGKLKLRYQEAQHEALLVSPEASHAPHQPKAKDHGSGCYAGCKRLLCSLT